MRLDLAQRDVEVDHRRRFRRRVRWTFHVSLARAFGFWVGLVVCPAGTFLQSLHDRLGQIWVRVLGSFLQFRLPALLQPRRSPPTTPETAWRDDPKRRSTTHGLLGKWRALAGKTDRDSGTANDGVTSPGAGCAQRQMQKPRLAFADEHVGENLPVLRAHSSAFAGSHRFASWRRQASCDWRIVIEKSAPDSSKRRLIESCALISPRGAACARSLSIPAMPPRQR